jgi:hypothetical protein
MAGRWLGTVTTALLVTTSVSVLTAQQAVALENGLSRTPVMGFNNWNSTHCRAEFNEEMPRVSAMRPRTGCETCGPKWRRRVPDRSVLLFRHTRLWSTGSAVRVRSPLLPLV